MSGIYPRDGIGGALPVNLPKQPRDGMQSFTRDMGRFVAPQGGSPAWNFLPAPNSSFGFNTGYESAREQAGQGWPSQSPLITGARAVLFSAQWTPGQNPQGPPSPTGNGGGLIFTNIGAGFSVIPDSQIYPPAQQSGYNYLVCAFGSGGSCSFYPSNQAWQAGIYTFQAATPWFWQSETIIGPLNNPTGITYGVVPSGLPHSIMLTLQIISARTGLVADVTPLSGIFGDTGGVQKNVGANGQVSYTGGNTLVSGWFNSRNYSGTDSFYPQVTISCPSASGLSGDSGNFDYAPFFDGAFIG